jgi:hypothetical protein
MKFSIDGVEYDGAKMSRFDTGNESEPTIFMDQYCQVFVVREQGGQKIVTRALTPEIHDLFKRYGIQSLLRALR